MTGGLGFFPRPFAAAGRSGSRRIRAVLGSALLTAASPLPAADVPAFPGAEGWGSQTPGGRGGRVLIVDRLADDGSPGTLRWAVNQPFPRIVVFRVSGILELEEPLAVGGPPGAEFESGNPYSYLTIAGQSAPGGGVTLTNYPISFRNDVHDVILRHLRVRNVRVDRRRGSIGDGIELAGAHHVVIDHVSVSWFADEGISIEGSDRRSNHDITVQHSLIAEGLLNGGHPAGPHSRCAIVSDGSHRISLHHNLMISCNRRNPSLAGNSELGSSPRPVSDVRYNLVYNFGEAGLQFGRGARTNVVGNLFRAGLDTTADRPLDSLDRSEAGTSIHLRDNCRIDRVGDGDVRACPEDQAELISSRGRLRAELSFDPHDAPSISPPADLERQLLDSAGALPRDAADRDFLTDYLEYGGELGAGGRSQDRISVPVPEPGIPPPDADRDGMADAWELARGLDPTDPGDAGGDPDGDGYTHVEEYLETLTDGDPDDSSSCVPDQSTLCLTGGRFRVRSSWRTTENGSGPGRTIPLTRDTGGFWFFSPDNVEIVVKVLDACEGYGRFWVFATGLTDVAVELLVEDTRTDFERTYPNGPGTPFPPIRDLAAFDCP